MQPDLFAAAGGESCGASAPPLTTEQRLRFRIACRMLRNAGHFEVALPGQRRGESPIDWLVRLNLASSPYVAAEMLILGRGLTEQLDWLCGIPDLQL